MRQYLRQLSVVIVIGAGAAAGCGGNPSEPPPTAAASAAPANAPASTAPSPAAAAPTTLAEIFPSGAGRDAVMNTCGSCHNVACSAMVGRPAARWDALRASHEERVAAADLQAAFGYLKTQFDESRPAPKIPPAFLEGGCTPF